jgi:ABC-2 type transport system permease protein
MNPEPSNTLARLRHYGSIYAALWRNSVVREMSFKSNFLLWIIVEFLWFGLQLSFVGVIYLHTDHIATWTKWDVVMLIGASHFIQEMFQAFFLTNCTQLSELVRTGRLDFMLLLPANARFLISLRQVDLGGFVNGACGLAVMAYAAHQEHLVPSAAQVIAFVLLCGVGILVHYSLMFLLASVAFWTVRAQGIVWGYYSLFNVARLPDEAFQGWFRAFFTFAIPMLLVVNVPVRVLLNRLTSPGQMFLLLGAGCVCFVLSELFWRFSIRHYTSASA